MKTAVALTFTADGYRKYAKNCLALIEKHWPWDVDVFAYPENFELHGRELHRVCPELVDFKARMERRPSAHGVRGHSYFYTYDAVKWCHRIFALKAAADESDAQILINMDADIVTFGDVTHEFLEGILGDADIAYMPRHAIKMYSECSFVLYRLENPLVRKFINDHQEIYTSGEIFQLMQWTDCHAFDHLLAGAQLKVRDINAGIPASMHPFVNGPLGSVMDHLKGPRKLEGHSRHNDLVVTRQEAYWA